MRFVGVSGSVAYGAPRSSDDMDVFIVACDERLWLTLGASILSCTAAAWIYYAASIRYQGFSLIRNIPYFALLGFVGYGISVSNTVQALRGVLSPATGIFMRTPKYAVRRRGDPWRTKKYQVPLDRTFWLELAATVLGLAAMVNAVKTTNWGIIPILALYTIAYAVVASLSAFQTGSEV